MNIAIIPARGGSKRIPGKNIKPFAGKPIIYYPITTAVASGLFDSVVVSTDDHEIADIATSFGAEVPFFRSAELSGDYIATAPVIVDALLHLKNKGIDPKNFCCIYPTAAFIKTTYLDAGYRLVKQDQVHAAIAVTSYPSPIFRALRLNSEGYVEMFWKEHLNTRSQDLPTAYMDAGQFYWGKTHQFLIEKNLYPRKAKPVMLPRYLVHDIDTLEDWETAEKIFIALSLDKPQFE
jgi:pseudaminic acid cytidylyltransferase